MVRSHSARLLIHHSNLKLKTTFTILEFPIGVMFFKDPPDQAKQQWKEMSRIRYSAAPILRPYILGIEGRTELESYIICMCIYSNSKVIRFG